MKQYEDVVKQIRELDWVGLEGEDLKKLLVLSYFAALEFMASLKIALLVYPDNKKIKEMAKGELKTSNLNCESYKKEGDHWEFLDWVIKEFKIADYQWIPEVVAVGQSYLEVVSRMPDDVRAMSIFSREKELSGIFRQIVNNKNWRGSALNMFKYYLERHIFLDSKEGGHADLVADLPIDNRLLIFYEARLDLYKAIPKLFKK